MIEVWSREKVADADLPAFLKKLRQERRERRRLNEATVDLRYWGSVEALRLERLDWIKSVSPLTPARMDARDALLVRMARMLGCGHELVREIEADATENHR